MDPAMLTLPDEMGYPVLNLFAILSGQPDVS